MKTAYLALGSNLGSREANLADALSLLKSPDVRIVRESRVIETDPVGLLDQPRFLNMVVEVETSFSAKQLLRRCQRIEEVLGRERKEKNGPRTIDLDIILFGKETVSLPGLEIPHPRFRERQFVLGPLVEIAPDAMDPVTGKSARQLFAHLTQGK